MSALRLPPAGWTKHTEQTGADALDAGAFHLSTTLTSGIVVQTVRLRPLTREVAEAMEHIAEHNCDSQFVTTPKLIRALLGADGKVDPTRTVFLTSAFAPFGGGRLLDDVPSLTVEAAIDSHFETVKMMMGFVVALGVA